MVFSSWFFSIDPAHRYINTRDESIFKDMDIPEKIKTDMLAIIEQKLTPQAMKLKAQIEVLREFNLLILLQGQGRLIII